jgi:tetratricopeptide (TPR) repeat protein
VAGGYLLFGNGTRAAQQGRQGEAAEILGRASRLIPWEERVLLARATALDQDGRPGEALPVIGMFNEIYPGYWLGWAVQGGVLGRLGMLEEADAAFLRAARLAPSSLPELPMLAYNAARTVPGALEDRLLLAKHAPALFEDPGGLPADASLEASRRFSLLAESLASSEPAFADSIRSFAARLVPAPP